MDKIASTEFGLTSLDYWRLCDELSVVQAALLVSGSDPSIETAVVENWSYDKRPRGYEAAKAAFSNALQSGNIKGRCVPRYEYDHHGNECGVIENVIDLYRSTLQVASLKEFLASRGLASGFFFPDDTPPTDYLNPAHPRYAPKLAAAVMAWLNAGDAVGATGKSPKQLLVKWLRENAASYGLTDEEGNPNETGIEETAKVANWQPSGGAPKTPGSNPPTL